ncbi:MAG: polysaccharide deacetylase family protein [Micromonosporaceae bacterium]|nr:polysaccharide deacetylase family protein [Micromonosporaceae bacterium]
MRKARPFLKRSIITSSAIVLAAALVSVALTVTATPSQAATCNGYVALTFDDGPNSNTYTLLNTLKAAGARATLFNIGQNVKNNAALAKAEKDAGMWIGNHSWSHQHMTSMGAAQMSSDLSQTQQAIQQATGTAPTIFRPPYGETNGTLQQAASALGLRTVTWDVDSRDWAGASTAAIVQAASQLQAGQIILMHDQYQTTIQAIGQIVSGLSNRGLCPGMISKSTGRAVAPDAG